MKENNFTVRLFDRAPAPGGNWLYTEETAVREPYPYVFVSHLPISKAEGDGVAPVAPAEPNVNVNPNKPLDAPTPNSQLMYPHLRVPLHRINAVPTKSPFREIAPFCVSANDLVNPLPAALLTGSGWNAYHPSPGSAELSSHAHYWYSTLPTSRLRVSVAVGARRQYASDLDPRNRPSFGFEARSDRESTQPADQGE